jgi:hypothetical protein
MNQLTAHRRILIVILIVILLPPAHSSSTRAAQPSASSPPIPFIKGHSWGWTGRRGEYASPEAADSLGRLAATGADTVCIAFATTMPDAQTPKFTWGEPSAQMVSDDEIRRAMKLARQHKLRVILKPVINCRDGTWRAWIKFLRPVTEAERTAGVAGHHDQWRDEPVFIEGLVPDDQQWTVWWDHYRRFILHYARIAEDNDVELFCVGCEMSSTEGFEDRWRQLIADVRAVYNGALIYNCNHGREREIAWWDAVDAIGVSAYYPVPPAEGVDEREAVKQTTPLNEILAALNPVKSELAALSEKWQRPILFIETGATSTRGAARHPWASGLDPLAHPTDQQEQANYYQAMFEVFHNEPWFIGYAWWDWPARLYPKEHAPNHRGFCAYGKQAEQVIRQWYAKPRNINHHPEQPHRHSERSEEPSSELR